MKRRRSIETLHPRVGAAFALIPMAFAVELVVAAAAMRGSFSAYFWLYHAPCVVFYGGSLLIWGPVVPWTVGRIRRTLGLSVGLLFAQIACSCAIQFLVTPGRVFQEIEYYFLPASSSLALGALGVFLLNIIWWSPAARDLDVSVPCPQCGYDLRGQRACRCPECGETFTLGEYIATRTGIGSDV